MWPDSRSVVADSMLSEILSYTKLQYLYHNKDLSNMALFCTFCVCIFIAPTLQRPINVKSVKLTPSNPTQNGASITTNSGEVTTNTDAWDISAVGINSWHLVTALDETWGFHPSLQSSLTFVIDNVPIAPDTFDPLLFAFTVHDSNKFIATQTEDCDQYAAGECLGTHHRNQMLPLTDMNSCPQDGSISQANGNLTAVMETVDDSCFERICSITPARANGWKFWSQINDDRTEVFPIKITLTNTPDDSVIFHYKSLISDGIDYKCVYEAFATNGGMKMYVAVAFDSDQASIASFNITYSLNFVTLDPTTDPTLNPTLKPSSDPTQNPTLYPRNPTAAPIETFSNDPNQTMTVSPSKEHTTTAIDTTSDPLIAYNDPLLVHSTPYNDPNQIQETTHDTRNVHIDMKSNNFMVLVFCIAIGSALCICGVAVYIFFFIGCNMKKQNKKHVVAEALDDVSVNKSANIERMSSKSMDDAEEIDGNISHVSRNEYYEYGIRKKQNKKHVTSTKGTNQAKCTQCGAVVPQGIDGYNVFICVICKNLNEKDIDKEVERMFEKEEGSIERAKGTTGSNSMITDCKDDVNVLSEGVRQKPRDSELMYVNNVDVVQKTEGNTQKTDGNTEKTGGNTKKTGGNTLN